MQSDLKKIPYNKYLKVALEQIPKGAFLTTEKDGKVNTMTIGWGTCGVMWGRPVFVVGVRPSRYTYQMIDNDMEFTISIPLNQKLKKKLAFCGTKSGRDVDKFKEIGLTAVKAKEVSVPIIQECELHYECKVVAKHQLISDLMDDTIVDRHYPEGDFHMIFYGEIKACYKSSVVEKL